MIRQAALQAEQLGRQENPAGGPAPPTDEPATEQDRRPKGHQQYSEEIRWKGEKNHHDNKYDYRRSGQNYYREAQ